ncbi:hypothetical protein GCM10027592_49210 [Spirosoma flavus]
MAELLTYMRLPASQFDACMFQKGFVCYKSTGGLNGWTCLFAYNGNTLLNNPATAPGLIQYSRNSRSDLIVYQVHSKAAYEALQKELIELGYSIEPVANDRLTYVRNNTVVTCQKTGTDNGISGNYTGYTVSLAALRY